MPNCQGRVLVTGANGHLGRLLISRLLTDSSAGGISLRAGVRSERAAAQIRAIPAVGVDAVDVRVFDYRDTGEFEAVAEGCRAVVHFVGIIKEGQGARYVDAHERTCEALSSAADAAGVDRIVYLSILGADPESTNACLASKGRAEEILLGGAVATVVLRVPMVLGPGDYASYSLRSQARSRLLLLPGGGATFQQPIDAADVIRAVLAALDRPEALRSAFDLGGPECLTHRELVARAARLWAASPVILPIPLALARAGISLLERVSSSPPVTRAMFDVLQHDDRVDAAATCKELGIQLTPLDDTLRAYVGPEAL